MQKVVGSSPIIRSSEARWKQRVFLYSEPEQRAGRTYSLPLDSARHDRVLAGGLVRAGVKEIEKVSHG
jgi:hypothetical protein